MASCLFFKKCDSSSIGRVSACHAEGWGIVLPLSLFFKYKLLKNEILDAFKRIENASYYKVAKELNISTNCLTKKCEKFGIKSKVIKLRFG